MPRTSTSPPGLGRDFWLYRLGQLASVIGDSCNKLALAWWILDETGSAATMATIVAPVTFVQLLLIPLFGPIGDRFSRKRVALLGDAWRLGTALLLGIMALRGYFNLPLIVVVSLLHGVGSALFMSVSQSIIPQLVSRENVEIAIQKDQAIMPLGTILGGVVGGGVVSWLGPAGALLIDAGTYFVATAATASIVAVTKVQSAESADRQLYSVRAWFQELKEGVRVVTSIPIELGVAVLAGLLNLAIAPLDISLAYFVKEAQNQPAWMLGLLETSMSVGAILGAMALGTVQRWVRRSTVVFIGLAASGVAIMVLPWARGVVLPSMMLLVFGMAVIAANIPLKSQTTLAMPDAFRSRAVSVRIFIGAIAAPAGIAVTGWLIATFGLEMTLVVSGGAVLALSFAVFLIPNYRVFFDADAAVTSRFYVEHYPAAFSGRGDEDSARNRGVMETHE
ncbi:MFS transporter [Myxococcus sp. AM009]|uniref:MFS transporter n=1 Tax=Myxococcus sp. AM009 TaxID=2745137 RepID=UPI0015963DE7|nr:MFS transporter [Myxococcus sp. AM009]NVI97309.1 MFS transporter [Myxococcus sp. AM009]